MTWNVTLPIDRSATLNQSDLYQAVWFGMDLSDPYGYDGQCLLELQFYPDTNGSYQPQYGAWSAIAVGWQINLATGVEDTCYSEPLGSGHTSAPFTMGEGDTLTVRMSGWIGSPYGENVTVTDNTNGDSGFLTLFNSSGNYPLDPAYLANDIDDSLLWSSGGTLPVFFAFGIGTTSNGPHNNTYGGCNAGVPPPTPLNPSTPCDSYDPQSWNNDTAQPWHFGPAKFFNHATIGTAVQVGFDQTTGGFLWLNPSSLGTCAGRAGSAYCSYPWFSYSRSQNAIEFGATDYYGMTYDFGQYFQYNPFLETNSAALGYFAPNNFTVPAVTAGADLTVTVSGLGAGSVHFLNYTLSATTTIDNLPAGSYSINSVPASGDCFGDYTVSGTAAIDAADSPWSSLRLTTGTAGVTVTFDLGVPPCTTVGLHVTIPSGHGFVAISNGFDLTTSATYPGLPTAQYSAVTWTNETNGGSDTVDPGMYSVQALPEPGYNFTGWSVSGNAYLFAEHSNYTWVNVSSTGGAPTLTANFVATTGTTTVHFESVPATGGTITFAGKTYDSGNSATLADGTYLATANANATYTFETWSYRWDAAMSEFPASTQVTVQGGKAWVYALFHSTPSITLAVAGTGTGSIGFEGALHTGSVSVSQVEATVYTFTAVPNPGSAFAGWSVNNPADLSVADPAAAVGSVLVNESGTLTATFTAGSEVAVTFDPEEAGGAITWNFNQLYSSTTTNDTVTPGTYVIWPTETGSLVFTGWNTTGAVSIVTLYSLTSLFQLVTLYELQVTGAGTVYASFATGTFPVTFVDVPSSTGTVATFTSTGTPVPIYAGTTAQLIPGTYSVKLSGGSIPTVRWVGTSNFTLSAASGLSVSVAVSGSGTLYALAISLPVVTSVVVSPSIVEPGVPFTVSTTVAGGTIPFDINSSLSSLSLGSIACTPTKVVSTTSTSLATCTLSVNTPVNYGDTVYSTVTDLAGFSASGFTALDVYGPPTLTFTTPESSDQLSSTSNLSLAVSWTNTVPMSALPGLEETVGLIDQTTGAYVTNTPTTTHTGLSSLWIPAAASNSVTLGPSDLLAGPRVAPGSYWVAVSFWSTALLNNDGYPTLLLTTVEEPLTVADVQLLSPATGTSTAAGNVTLAYALNGPGITSAQLTVKNQSGLVSNTTLTLQPPSGTGDLVLYLHAGSYTATLDTFNDAANEWLNSTSTFTVAAPSTVIPPPVYHNTTSVPGYIDYVYTALLILGTLIGLLVMWALTRRRREPPNRMAPLTPAAVPPAVAPGVPQGIPPGPAEWDEDTPPRGATR